MNHLKKNDTSQQYQNDEYLSKNSDWHVKDCPWKAKQIASIINRHNLNLSTICEVGCGAGEILRQLSLMEQFKSVSFFGYEISQVAYNLSKERQSDKITFFHENILNKDINYDAVLCIDVFEHVENYMEFLKDLKKKSGYKIFHIPLDISVIGLFRGTMLKTRKLVGHLHYFTPETAIATLESCGYEIIDKNFTPGFDLPTQTFMSKLAKFPRSILYRISPSLMSRLIGGASLMVLTK